MTEATVHSHPVQHPRYLARRRCEVRALVHHTLGTLFVLTALVLILNL